MKVLDPPNYFISLWSSSRAALCRWI